MSDSPPSPTPQRPAVRTAGAPGQRQQVQPGLNLSSIAPQSPPRPPAPGAEGTRAGLGRVSQGRRCLFLPAPAGTETGQVRGGLAGC